MSRRRIAHRTRRRPRFLPGRVVQRPCRRSRRPDPHCRHQHPRPLRRVSRRRVDRSPGRTSRHRSRVRRHRRSRAAEPEPLSRPDARRSRRRRRRPASGPVPVGVGRFDGPTNKSVRDRAPPSGCNEQVRNRRRVCNAGEVNPTAREAAASSSTTAVSGRSQLRRRPAPRRCAAPWLPAHQRERPRRGRQRSAGSSSCSTVPGSLRDAGHGRLAVFTGVALMQRRTRRECSQIVSNHAERPP